MKKTFKAVLFASSGGGSGAGRGEDDDEGSDPLEEALFLLRDHRELSCLPPPAPLPSNVADPETFPYFQPPSGWATVDGEPPYVKELQAEAYRATLYIRDDWIRKQMKSKEQQFTNKHELKVWVGTYNVNGKKPEFPVDMFVCAGEKKRGDKFCHDLVVVGFQEMVDLNVQNAVSDTATKERTAQWLQLIERSLEDSCRRNGEDGYALLGTKSLVGLMICVFVLKKHRPNVAGVQTCSVATGVMGVVGNKGACAVRFELFDTSFCFVCAHLAAHTDAVDARNMDYRTINSKTSFKLDPPVRSFVPERHHSRIAATTPGALARGELLIKEHDYVVWLGDFNYRMDASNSPESVFERVQSADFPWLYANDQLMNEMKGNRVFQGLKEVAHLQFLPTYKFEPGTDFYDRRPEKKVRAPAWTDRILWRVPPGDENQARCVVYDKVDAMRASDHKPVEASLVPVVRVINDEQRNEVYKEVLRKFNGISSTMIPEETLRFEPSLLDFGPVVYRRECQPLFLTVSNPSSVPLCWRMVSRPGLNDLCASWLTVEPTFGLLLPGESAQVRVDCLVGLETARVAASAEGPLQLKDTLDIRVHPVLDQGAHTLAIQLIQVQCDLRPTCFGAQIASLLWALKPVRTFGTGDAQYSALMNSSSNQGDAQALAVPKELWRLVYRLKNKVGEHRVFLHHAEKDECARVRDCLDEGTPFPPEVSTHAYASVLLEFLDALAEPVVPADNFPESAEAMSDPMWPSTFLAQLPTPNANVMVMVLALVQRAMVMSQHNKLAVSTIAPLFAEVLFRPSIAAEANKEMSAATASGLGEFASWLTSSVPFTSSSSKTDSRAMSNLATQAFTILLNAR